MNLNDDSRPRLVVSDLRPGKPIQRRPCGRFCCVERLNEGLSKVLVRDDGRCFWLKTSTLLEKWA